MEKTIPKAKGREVMKTVSLIDLCYSVTDCPHSTPKWTNAGKIVIRNQNIRNGRLDISSVSYTTQEDYDKRIKRALPNAGDIIITREAPMGEVCMIPDDLECCLGQRMVLLKPNRDLADNNYLLYALMSPYVKNQISWSEGTGTTVSNLRIPHLEKLQIPIFELKKQRKIAKLLANLDKKIEVNNEINDNLEQQAMVLYGKSFPYAVADELPAGWRVGTVGEIIEIHDSKRIPLSGAQRAKMEKRIYPYYGAASLMDYVDEYIFDGKYLLLGEDGTVVNDAGYPVLQYVWGQFWVNNHAHILTGKLGFNVESLFLLFKHTPVKSIVTGAVQPKISQANLRSIQVVIPPRSELDAFNELICPLFGQIRQNQDQNKLLATLRDTLLPKLMSGEIDVSAIQL